MTAVRLVRFAPGPLPCSFVIAEGRLSRDRPRIVGWP